MATPSFGDSTSRVGNFLFYPRRVLLEALELGFASEYFYTEEGRTSNPFLYRRNEDGETADDSKLEIADGWSRELEKTDPRPIIICQRESFQFHDSSINGLQNVDMPHGKFRTFADFTRMPLNFLCFSRVHLESEELGLVTAFFLRFFKDHLRNKAKFLKISSPVVGPTTPITTDVQVDLFSTPISIETYMTIRWKTTWTALEEANDLKVDINVVP